MPEDEREALPDRLWAHAAQDRSEWHSFHGEEVIQA